MPREGRELEKLVEALENYLSGENVSIESPGFVEDKEKKGNRFIFPFHKIFLTLKKNKFAPLFLKYF